MKNHAFTLIELLVVVLIIGILSAVAVPQYEKTIIKSRFGACHLLAENMLKAAEVFYLNNGVYAEDPDSLDVSFPAPNRREYSEGIKRTYFRYSWGHCQYDAGSSIGCYNEVSGIAYQRSLTGTKKRECKAASTKPVSKQFCQSETGKTSPDYDGGDWLSYFY